jgi:hypothetical protein
MHIAGNGLGASIFFWRDPDNATSPRREQGSNPCSRRGLVGKTISSLRPPSTGSSDQQRGLACRRDAADQGPPPAANVNLAFISSVTDPVAELGRLRRMQTRLHQENARRTAAQNPPGARMIKR